MTYLRAVAMAHGHGPAAIDALSLRDLEALAVIHHVPDTVKFTPGGGGI